jgi:hypothetical protein
VIDGERRLVVRYERRMTVSAAAVEREEKTGEGQTVAVNMSSGSSCVNV